MNCKPGDLAVVRSAQPSNNGIFVKVLEWFPEMDGWYIDPMLPYIGAEGQPMPAHNKGAWAPDSILQPIRGLPTTVTLTELIEA